MLDGRQILDILRGCEGYPSDPRYPQGLAQRKDEYIKKSFLLDRMFLSLYSTHVIERSLAEDNLTTILSSLYSVLNTLCDLPAGIKPPRYNIAE